MQTTVQNSNACIRWTVLSNLEDIDYADDLAFLSHIQCHMPSKTSDLQKNYSMLSRNIKIRKTEIFLNTSEPPVTEHILLFWTFAAHIHSLSLGSLLISDGGAEQEIEATKGKARAAFKRLRKIWKSTSISWAKKVKIHNGCVLSVLLYGAQAENDRKDWLENITWIP